MSRKLEKLITHGQKLEFEGKVGGLNSTSGPNNITPAALTPEAKVALQRVQEIYNAPIAALVCGPSTYTVDAAAGLVRALSQPSCQAPNSNYQ